jgi:hypothetical protein
MGEDELAARVRIARGAFGYAEKVGSPRPDNARLGSSAAEHHRSNDASEQLFLPATGSTGDDSGNPRAAGPRSRESPHRLLDGIPPGERVLLLPHCLRPSETCPGRPSREGFRCPADCKEECPIRTLREEAVRLGYKGVCIAPGGSLALRFVQDAAPQAVIAVACAKELAAGEEAVAGLGPTPPLVVVIPLSRDGCVDTEVSLDSALNLLRAGTSAG